MTVNQNDKFTYITTSAVWRIKNKDVSQKKKKDKQ